jgi:hypothetical protein
MSTGNAASGIGPCGDPAVVAFAGRAATAGVVGRDSIPGVRAVDDGALVGVPTGGRMTGAGCAAGATVVGVTGLRTGTTVLTCRDDMLEAWGDGDEVLCGRTGNRLVVASLAAGGRLSGRDVSRVRHCRRGGSTAGFAGVAGGDCIVRSTLGDRAPARDGGGSSSSGTPNGWAINSDSIAASSAPGGACGSVSSISS